MKTLLRGLAAAGLFTALLGGPAFAGGGWVDPAFAVPTATTYAAPVTTGCGQAAPVIEPWRIQGYATLHAAPAATCGVVAAPAPAPAPEKCCQPKVQVDVFAPTYVDARQFHTHTTIVNNPPPVIIHETNHITVQRIGYVGTPPPRAGMRTVRRAARTPVHRGTRNRVDRGGGEGGGGGHTDRGKDLNEVGSVSLE